MEGSVEKKAPTGNSNDPSGLSRGDFPKLKQTQGKSHACQPHQLFGRGSSSQVKIIRDRNFKRFH